MNTSAQNAGIPSPIWPIYPPMVRWLKVLPGTDWYPSGTVLGIDPDTKPMRGDLAAYQKGGSIWVERECGQGGSIGAVVVVRYKR